LCKRTKHTEYFHQLSLVTVRVAEFCFDKAIETNKEKPARLWISLVLRAVKTVSAVMNQHKVDEIEKQLSALERATKQIEETLLAKAGRSTQTKKVS